MKGEGQITSVNSSEKTDTVAPEQTVAAPHFDAAARVAARPAVPLSEVKRAQGWPTGTLLALAIVAGLAGGLLGGSLTGFFTPQVSDSGVVNATTSVTPATPSGAPAQPATQQPSPAESAAREETPAGRNGAGMQPGESVTTTAAAVPQETETALRDALGGWVAATNARDLEKQLSFYNPVVDSFYRLRNASLRDVRADKARVFERASSIDVRADAPDIRLSPDGRTAVMRFHKRYSIAGGGEDRSGEVLQELRWKYSDGRWRITSERDLRVVQ